MDDPALTVRDLTMAFGERVLVRGLDFAIRRGEVFVVMGGSGCGKSTLLRQMVGLDPPLAGDVYYSGEAYWGADDERREHEQQPEELWVGEAHLRGTP